MPRAALPAASQASSQSPYEKAWSRSPFPTIQNSQALLHRLRFILRRQARETWLPLHLRNRVKQSCERLMARDRNRDLSPQEAQKEIERLALVAYRYNDLTLRSSTLCQIRALDMEMNERRYRQIVGLNFNPGLTA